MEYDNLNQVPENVVQKNFINELIQEYGYHKRNIETEFSIRIGSGYKRADIVIFYNNTSHIQQNVYMIVEVKRHNSSTSKEGAFNQLYSYASACANCKYGILLIGKELSNYSWENKNDGRKLFSETEGIPYNFNKEHLVKKTTSHVLSDEFLSSGKNQNNSNDFTTGCVVSIISLIVVFIIFLSNPLVGAVLIFFWIYILGSYIAIKSYKKKRE